MNPSVPSQAAQAILTPIPALSDNYIWMVQKNGHALVVDPGESGPVEDLLRNGPTLEAILITHHHGDHVGGVRALQQRTGARVYGPRHENIPALDVALSEGDTVDLPGTGLRFHVLDIPGHTAGHIAYAGLLGLGRSAVFCGDTLFAAGCGRLFEGTPAQMLDSLDKLARLPPDTLVCCAHEYTESNIRWALQVEPGNAALQARAHDAARLRAQGLPTLPSTISLERETNPFLRTGLAGIRAAAGRHAQAPLDTPQQVFAALRQWKNDFR
ncbi:hydroxyacylglutathione hydrolase [Castellaniella sp.]|jgi:hydroxyacylglutathione hydrolase|uniref:hydroxyacylglutathione hydrolase n=1 Tax=Castellaniella sp. TaxID=1955812 RepID=UPI002D800BD6|nr:hydroxyacylglutathione hydrolase [Castellaniella sp.]HET8704299.1 hydroxyacylglutathione hydrolase [Castellaniella sp.]